MKPPESAAASQKIRILVVEDTATVAELIREMLLSFGYQVQLCLNAREAVATFEPGRFDLVITDYTMPGMSGLEFSQAVRAKSPGEKILLITGSAFSLSADSAMPVNGILQKPFSAQEFEAAVLAALRPPVITALRSTGDRPRL